jgi:predicted GNAT family acetyltransferase
VRVSITHSAEDFAAHASELLASRIEHNVLATVLDHARFRPFAGGGLFAYVEDDDGRVIAAALRTPPRRMHASVMDADTGRALIDEWLQHDPELPGVGAVREVARSLGHAWADRTGGTTTLAVAEALHTLNRVTVPGRPASGRLRGAGEEDRALLVDWSRAFAIEAGRGDDADASENVDRGLARGALHIWEDGAPVSLVGREPLVARVVRIGSGYTPPAWRSRGYASSAVAALSGALLEGGARKCALYTDLANPTSNRIYPALGYRRVAEWEERNFTRRMEEASNPPPS